jgi:SAM-dependent methyltransferase
VHDTALAFARRHVEAHGPFSDVVEFGSLNINGTPRGLIPDGTPYLGVDIQDGPGVDVIGDIVTIDIPAARDLVLCMEVLEHAPDQGGIVAKAAGVLAPGGHLVLTAATDPRSPHSAIDERPIRDWEHYRNVDPAEMDEFLTGWVVCEIDRSVLGDYYVCARRPDTRGPAVSASVDTGRRRTRVRNPHQPR